MQPEWTLNGKIPVIWVIDDFNTALSAACREGSGLFDAQGAGRLRQLMEETCAHLSINFVIVPEYARAGIPSLAELEIPMHDPALKPYHDELQEWLGQMGDRVEVTVHGWTHRMQSYSSDVEINPGGWEYTRRSEWLYNPSPVANYRRCIDALTELGYHPVKHVFSNCGGRMDRNTLRRLRNSEFRVLAKFPTQPEACRADYPDVCEMPSYLEDIDAFVFDWGASCQSEPADFERLFVNGKPIFLVNHGYEFYAPWFKLAKSYNGLHDFVREHSNDLVFVRYGAYAKTMHERVRGERSGAE